MRFLLGIVSKIAPKKNRSIKQDPNIHRRRLQRKIIGKLRRGKKR
jgi:hypothetical protein